MDIKIEHLNLNDDEQIHSLVKWENDPELYHLLVPIMDKDKSEPIKTFESLKKTFVEKPDYASSIFIILDGKKPVGNFSIQLDPEHLMNKVEGTSWLGLTIGEKAYWGKGVAKIAMDYFEAESKRRGASRVELGTFEFNERAYSFYKKIGYVEIGRLDKFTYWNGKYWDDIRMEKIL